MAYYTIHLERVEVVQPVQVLRFVIRAALEPLVRAAGYQLNLVNVSATRATSVTPDVSLEFRLNRDVYNPRARMLAEQSGVVLVGSILNMRVENAPTLLCTTEIDPTSPLRGPRRDCHVDYGGAVRHLFSSGEGAFARAVGNIAVHELGHTIGALNHASDPTNFMFTGASIERVLGPGARTHENLRRLWSGPHRFDERQRAILTRAIRDRTLLGVEMSRVSHGSSPTPAEQPRPTTDS